MIQMTKGKDNTTTSVQDEEEATTLGETNSSEDPIDGGPCPQKIRKFITGLIFGILIGIITIAIFLAVIFTQARKNIPLHSDDSRAEPIKSAESEIVDKENDKGRSQDNEADKKPDRLNEKDLKSGSGQVNQSSKETTGEKSDRKV